jgi:hypothetical protein
VPCTSWYEDKNDRELLHLLPILEKLSYVPDVRQIIPQIKDHEGERLLFDKARQMLKIPEPISDNQTKRVVTSRSIKEMDNNKLMLLQNKIKEKLEAYKQKSNQ